MDPGNPPQVTRVTTSSYNVQPSISPRGMDVQSAETGGHRIDDPRSKEKPGRGQAPDLYKPLPPVNGATSSAQHLLAYPQGERLRDGTRDGLLEGPRETKRSNRLRKKGHHSRDTRREPPQESSLSLGFLFGGTSSTNYPGDNRHHDDYQAQRVESRSGGGGGGYWSQYEVRPSDNEIRLHNETIRYQQAIAQLEDELRQAYATANHSVDRMQLAMDNKELFVGAQASDDMLQRKFSSLFNQVKTWAGKFRPRGVPPFDCLDESIKAEFEVVAPGCTESSKRDMWEEGKSLRLLIRGWLGLLLSENVFRVRTGAGAPGKHSDAMDQWMGLSLQKSVGAIEDTLADADRSEISSRDLQDWRALTVELLSKIDLGETAAEDKQKFIEDQVRRVLGVVSAFEAVTTMPELDASLRQIFENAIQLSQLLRRQRACWSVTTAVYFRFDPGVMKDDREDDDEEMQGPPRDKLVKLLITPGLFKRGNADGEGYEHQSCMVPMLVLCETRRSRVAEDFSRCR